MCIQNNPYKYSLKITKKDELRFISHLDWQNVILKIFRRLNTPLVLSCGFNKMPKISYSPALPIFIESKCEIVNFQTTEKLNDDFIKNFQKNSPNGIDVLSLKELNEEELKNIPKSLENYIQWAQYSAKINYEKNHVYNCEKIRYIIEKCLSSNELLITKKTKKGIEKTTNYRDSIKSLTLKDDDVLTFVLKVGQNERIHALRADEFLKAIFTDLSIFKITREEFFDTNLQVI